MVKEKEDSLTSFMQFVAIAFFYALIMGFLLPYMEMGLSSLKGVAPGVSGVIDIIPL